MRYRCSCGYEAQETPSAPDREIVSVYHIHRCADIRQLAEIVCMEPVLIPAEVVQRMPEPVGAASR
ncbi:MAG TPA: hypothetical protein VKW09_06725 [bacterium]|nr:hypothetical protein [bacterium]